MLSLFLVGTLKKTKGSIQLTEYSSFFLTYLTFPKGVSLYFPCHFCKVKTKTTVIFAKSREVLLSFLRILLRYILYVLLLLLLTA